MGMSTHVIGFRPVDDVWRKHEAVWKACKAAGVDPPAATRDFFDDQEPDDTGIEVNLGDAEREWDDGDMRAGIEVDLTKVPANVKVLRFYNSW